MISHLLLDIEGTTCPISFVSDVLFPYATQQLEAFIEQNHSNKDINKILQSAIKEHNQDNDWLRNNRAIGLLNEPSDNRLEITNYLKHLISIDKKSTALKDLQGKIWKHGYTRGDIVSTLFPETMTCLTQWRSMDLTLAVYSSGSIEAQQLLYHYTNSGNLKPLFSHWFDTHTGPKKEAKSYSTICNQMQVEPSAVLFISDSGDECDAAQCAGLETLFSHRAENPDTNPRGHRKIDNLKEVSSVLNQRF